VLTPGSRALARLIDAVGAFGNDAFQAMQFDKLEHVRGGALLDGGQAWPTTINLTG